MSNLSQAAEEVFEANHVGEKIAKKISQHLTGMVLLNKEVFGDLRTYAIMMVEGSALEISEVEMIEALEFGHGHIKNICEAF